MPLCSLDFEVIFKKKKMSSPLEASIIYNIWADLKISIDLHFKVQVLS